MQARKLSTDNLEKLATIARSLFDLANRKSEKETEERVEWILEKYPDLTLDEAILIERDSYVDPSRIHHIAKQIEEKEIEKIVQQRNKATNTA